MNYTDADQNVAGLYDEGVPGVRLPTQLSAKHLNQFTLELLNILIANGTSPSDATNQLKDALVRTKGTQSINGVKSWYDGAGFESARSTQTVGILNTNLGSTGKALNLQTDANDWGLDILTSQPGALGGINIATSSSTGAGLKIVNSGSGQAANFSATSAFNALSVAQAGAGNAVSATGGNGAGVAGRFSTGNIANVAAVYATTAHGTRAVFAEKTAGTGTTEAAVWAKSSGYALVAEPSPGTLGETVRAPLRIIGTVSAPSAPQDGDVYYDTTTNKLRVRAGGAWADLH